MSSNISVKDVYESNYAAKLFNNNYTCMDVLTKIFLIIWSRQYYEKFETDFKLIKAHFLKNSKLELCAEDGIRNNLKEDIAYCLHKIEQLYSFSMLKEKKQKFFTVIWQFVIAAIGFVRDPNNAKEYEKMESAIRNSNRQKTPCQIYINEVFALIQDHQQSLEAYAKKYNNLFGQVGKLEKGYQPQDLNQETLLNQLDYNLLERFYFLLKKQQCLIVNWQDQHQDFIDEMSKL